MYSLPKLYMPILSDGKKIKIFLYPQTVQIFVVPMDCVCQTQAGAMD